MMGTTSILYNLIDNFGFENINPNTAVIDTKGTYGLVLRIKF